VRSLCWTIQCGQHAWALRSLVSANDVTLCLPCHMYGAGVCDVCLRAGQVPGVPQAQCPHPLVLVTMVKPSME
jgi:hypothetical protein